MGRLIERLLLLASADASKVVASRTDARVFIDEVRARWSMLGDREVRRGRSRPARFRSIATRPCSQSTLPSRTASSTREPGDPIELSSRTDGERLVIEIKDWGPGISPATYRTSSSASIAPIAPATAGTVVPASASRSSTRSLDAHGGKASVRSALGEGTVVSLSFPGYVPGVAQDVAATTHRVDVDERAELAT